MVGIEPSAKHGRNRVGFDCYRATFRRQNRVPEDISG